MTVDRESLETLTWRKTPAEMKVSASGVKWVMVGGKLADLTTLSDSELFTIMRRISVAKTISNALKEAA